MLIWPIYILTVEQKKVLANKRAPLGRMAYLAYLASKTHPADLAYLAYLAYFSSQPIPPANLT